MAEVKPGTSRGEDPIELEGEASCSGADVSTYPESSPPQIVADSPSFLTWMWIQILTACSGVWGARGGLRESRMLGLASGAHQMQEHNESGVLSRIAASKRTWSEVRSRDIHDSVLVPCPSQLSVWMELKECDPRFFSDEWNKRLEIGRQIGEGSQAEIFEAKVEGLDFDLVVKVFKLDAGFSLADLKRQWPRCMREDEEDCSESTSGQGKRSGFVFQGSNHSIFRCLIVRAALLEDGRFAFLMQRYSGDLRTLIDQTMEYNTHPWEFDSLSQPPFPFDDCIRIMLCIARGMHGLHAAGVLHRDLKAANVLFDYSLDDNGIFCNVADYECAMFVKGTGFWRAPEVLQELLKKNGKDPNGKIWTKEVDVYGFGMTCYEVLTGQIPFDGCTRSKWDDVIKGERPLLPDYVPLEVRELVEACWHRQDSQRPSFDIIVEKLSSLWSKNL